MSSVVSDPAIDCSELVVRYGDVVAVDGLSLRAERGQVLAVLGPNGAGKTSTVETLEGYRRPAGGSVRVLGLDPQEHRTSLVGHIGVMLQRGGIYPTMAARDVLELFSRYYRDPEDPAALLAQVGLTGVARTPWKRLSGGEQQRLSLALALVGRPEVLFLDEPTAGVDPEGRIAVRGVIRERRDAGACVLLTTHELSEAERLADEVLILAAGRAVARGTLAELAAAAGHGAIRFTAPRGTDMAELTRSLGGATVTEKVPGEFVINGDPTPARLSALASFLASRDLPLAGVRAGEASLEDLYLRVTGAEGAEPTPDIGPAVRS